MIAEPPCKAFSIGDYPPGGILMAFGMGDAGQLGMGEDIMERRRFFIGRTHFCTTHLGIW